MGVTYGVRETVIQEAIRYTERTGMVAANIVVAQGTMTQDGKDAQFSITCLSNYSPNLCRNVRMDCASRLVCLDPTKIVKAGQVLAP